MEINNDLPEEEIQKPIDSSQLSYEENTKVGDSVSKVIDELSPKEGQHAHNKALALKNTPKLWGKGVPNNNSNMISSQNTINI